MARAPDLAPRLLEDLSDPLPRPLAIHGVSGSGKTRLLRSVVEGSGREAVWNTAFALVGQMTEAMRSGRYEPYRQALIDDDSPLCIEHLEDLRGKPVTRGEVRRLLEDRARRGRATLLTVTRARGDQEVLEWLEPWAELLRLDRGQQRLPAPRAGEETAEGSE
jgi:chromosomal replication initiation ATPase DnaA